MIYSLPRLLLSRFHLESSIALSFACHILVFLAVTQLSNSNTAELPTSYEVQIVDIKGSKAGDGLTSKVPPKSSLQKVITTTPALSGATDANTTTQKLAVGGTRSSEAGTGQFGVEDGRQATLEERYSLELRQLLEKYKTYPLMAKKLGLQGRVTVRFILNQKGEVLESEITSSAASDLLNKAALELVKRIHGVKPFPEGSKKQTWLFEVPVDYKL